MSFCPLKSIPGKIAYQDGLFFFIRKVQKSLVDLEKLHFGGQGENLFLSAAVGHNSQNKVLLY